MADDGGAVAEEATELGWRRFLRRLPSIFSWTWLATGLTIVAFGVLYRVHLLGQLPIGVLVCLLVVAAAANEVVGRWCESNPSPRRLWLLVGMHILATTIIIYAIGFGPTLAIGYLFIVARDLEDFGSRVLRPALFWTAVGLLLGQVAVGLTVVNTHVPQPFVHGLAGLTFLGLVFAVHLLCSKTLQRELDAIALAAGESNFRQLFADNPQPMWVFDTETLGFLEVNEAAISHYGYQRHEFLARSVSDVYPAEDLPRLAQEVELQGHGARQSGWRHRLSDGRLIDVEVNSHALTFAARPAMLVAVQDVTQRTALEAELRHQAFHDSLTNLANRALFMDRADHAIQRLERGGASVAVLMLDLDGFKNVNDSLGHSVGDTLLVAVAARLQTALRSGDTAARLGGDEFAILVEDVSDPEAAALVADRLMEALAPPFSVTGKELFVHGSVGIALTTGDKDAEELLRDADAAMYQAKAHGKGCHRMFEPAMYSASLARLELEGDFRRALQLDEFVLHYQPVVAIGTSRVLGLEALVRWQHPTRGLVQPNEFISLAEENGLIVEIGRWVLREACLQARSWQQTKGNEALTIAVNLSARQLADPNLVEDVAQALADSGLSAASLTLEITESVLMQDPTAAVATLRQLKAAGVRLAIDDFGTGYSSLSSLQHLPVDTLKIDKTFIDGVADGVEAAGLVEAIVRLAGTLALETIAEGVERPEQLESLQVLGCQQIQGFYFSKPLSSLDVEKFLLQHGTDDNSHAAAAHAVRTNAAT